MSDNAGVPDYQRTLDDAANRSNEPVSVSVDLSSSCAVATVAGDLDLETAPAVLATLSGYLTATSGGLIVDLRPLGFCGSAGLAMLIELNTRAAEHDQPFIVVADGVLLRPIEILGLDEILMVHRDVASARQAIEDL